MANWCYSSTTIFGEKTQLEKFKKDLLDAVSENPTNFEKVENSWNNLWLGNIFLSAGYEQKDIDSRIFCRGGILCYTINEDSVEITYESAWRPIFEYIDLMLKEKYGNLLKQVTLAEEASDEIFINTDIERKFYKDEYYLDVCLNDVYNDEHYFITEEEMLKELNDVLKTNYKTYDEVIEDFQNIYELHEEDDSFFLQISKFKNL